MKKHTFGILCLTVLAVCACGKEFELEVTSDPKLFLQCCPGPGDTTIIQLNRTFAVGRTADNVLLLEDADIDFVVNGTPYYVARAVDTAGAVPPGCWFVVASLQAGDEVAVEARADGFNPVSARVMLPSPAPDFTWKFNRDSVRVTFRDDPATEDWYGLAVYCERTLINLDTGQVERVLKRNLMPLNGSSDSWWYSKVRNYVDIPFNGWSFGNAWSMVRVWPDTGFSGQETTLFMPTRDIVSYVGNYEQHDRFKVRLYRVSNEFFRYGVALEHMRSTTLAEAGLAPAAYAYSNVHGGVGVLAAWNVCETGWLTLP